MAGRHNDTERAIVSAFLRFGHPQLAFGTVVLRSVVRLSIFALAAGTVIATGQGGGARLMQLVLSLLAN